MNSIQRSSFEDINLTISEVEMLDLKTVSNEKLHDIFEVLTKGYVVSTPTLNPGLLVYRGIMYDKKPQFLSELSYPPAEKAKLGRANREGESKFYCTNDKYVPFYELNAKVGDRLIISEWSVVKGLLVNNVGYTNSNFSELSSSRPLPDFTDTRLIDEDQKKEVNKVVQNFLAKTFSQKILEEDIHKYKLTNAIAEAHFSESEHFRFIEFKGLIYPTIKMQANAENIVLTKKSIDTGYLQFEKVEFIEILAIVDNVYKFKVIDLAFNIVDNVIQWKDIKDSWVWDSQSEIYFIDSDNEINAFDSDGEMIPNTPNNA